MHDNQYVTYIQGAYSTSSHNLKILKWICCCNDTDCCQQCHCWAPRSTSDDNCLAIDNHTMHSKPPCEVKCMFSLTFNLFGCCRVGKNMTNITEVNMLSCLINEASDIIIILLSELFDD